MRFLGRLAVTPFLLTIRTIMMRKLFQQLSLFPPALALVLAVGLPVAVSAQNQPLALRARLDTAVFAGGCFWSMERPFQHTPGVLETAVGFAGGHVKNPSYEAVSTGRTGHLESVRVVYDPARTSYDKLLYVFWRNVDPFVESAQFCDTGSEYQTAVFVSSHAQLSSAISSLRSIEARFGKPVLTRLLPAAPFYRAEEYHQHFADKNPVYYGQYRRGCGRDARLAVLWGKEAAPFVPAH
jgi:peptide-methionine (S)-S-oxide reductase